MINKNAAAFHAHQSVANAKIAKRTATTRKNKAVANNILNEHLNKRQNRARARYANHAPVGHAGNCLLVCDAVREYNAHNPTAERSRSVPRNIRQSSVPNLNFAPRFADLDTAEAKIQARGGMQRGRVFGVLSKSMYQLTFTSA